MLTNDDDSKRINENMPTLEFITRIRDALWVDYIETETETFFQI